MQPSPTVFHGKQTKIEVSPATTGGFHGEFRLIYHDGILVIDIRGRSPTNQQDAWWYSDTGGYK